MNQPIRTSTNLEVNQVHGVGLSSTFKHRLSMNGLLFTDLFCGIGGFHAAASELGGKCVFACDIDLNARKAYRANYGLDAESDITKVDPTRVPDHDFLFAGFPCQPFSIIGKRMGFFDPRGGLFFDVVRILKAKQPRMALLENVKQLSTHDGGRTLLSIKGALESVGYHVHVKVLNALDYGLPQKRERTTIACFKDEQAYFRFAFPPPAPSYVPLERMLEKDVPAKYYASQRIADKRKMKHVSDHKLGIWHENKGGHVSSYPYSCALRAGASYNYLLVNGERRLTPREMLRLQGFPDSFKIVCNDSQTRTQAGNAIPVPMMRAVMESMLDAS